MAGPRKGLNRKFATSATACEQVERSPRRDRLPGGAFSWALDSVAAPALDGAEVVALETDEIQHAVPWAIDPFLDLDLVALAPFPDDLAITQAVAAAWLTAARKDVGAAVAGADQAAAATQRIGLRMCQWQQGQQRHQPGARKRAIQRLNSMRFSLLASKVRM